jgi:hypothetical protein
VRSVVRIKDRSWSGASRVDAEHGVSGVKQNCPGVHQEARVVSVLSCGRQCSTPPASGRISPVRVREDPAA